MSTLEELRKRDAATEEAVVSLLSTDDPSDDEILWQMEIERCLRRMLHHRRLHETREALRAEQWQMQERLRGDGLPPDVVRLLFERGALVLEVIGAHARMRQLRGEIEEQEQYLKMEYELAKKRRAEEKRAQAEMNLEYELWEKRQAEAKRAGGAR